MPAVSRVAGGVGLETFADYGAILPVQRGLDSTGSQVIGDQIRHAHHLSKLKSFLTGTFSVLPGTVDCFPDR
jgi:hypothetical protein